jgi:hypothetical protein
VARPGRLGGVVRAPTTEPTAACCRRRRRQHRAGSRANLASHHGHARDLAGMRSPLRLTVAPAPLSARAAWASGSATARRSYGAAQAAVRDSGVRRTSSSSASRRTPRAPRALREKRAAMPLVPAAALSLRPAGRVPPGRDELRGGHGLRTCAYMHARTHARQAPPFAAWHLCTWHLATWHAQRSSLTHTAAVAARCRSC